MERSSLPFSSQLLEHSFPSHSCSLVPLLASPFGKCEFNILCMRLLADGTGEEVSMRTLSEVFEMERSKWDCQLEPTCPPSPVFKRREVQSLER